MTNTKVIERLGRRLLIDGLARLLRVAPQAPVVPADANILVIRLDERLGNLLLLTPLLRSLRARFPAARIDLLAGPHAQQVLGSHPAINTVLPFRKRALFAADGPLRTPWRLRQRRYDLCIDAANPTDPSATQAILTRLSGAPCTVGSAVGGFGPLYSAPVTAPTGDVHEIDLRLSLLDPLPGQVKIRDLSLGTLAAPSSPVAKWLDAQAARPFAVLNIGARLRDKRLQAGDYASVAALLQALGLPLVLTWGPAEEALAREVAQLQTKTILAPPTRVTELAALMQRASAVISCDTGPMHLGVAMGVPTCGIFVSTDPTRFGYALAPHGRIDARTAPRADWLQQIYSWAVHLQVPRHQTPRTGG